VVITVTHSVGGEREEERDYAKEGENKWG